MCDKMMANGIAVDEASALRVCVLQWENEHAEGLEFTEIPIEYVRRGPKSVQTFIDNLKVSKTVMRRRKICLVGSSCAGKTTFVKSIIMESPQLVYLDDRTIGINHFPLTLKDHIHIVTFWDFAGQDVYQVAHSAFFSPRTLFFVFIDLEAFMIGFMQAWIFADRTDQESMLLKEFVEVAVFHWVHMILARQPDAELVFIVTKEDAVSYNAFVDSVMKTELKKLLSDIDALVMEMKNAATRPDDSVLPKIRLENVDTHPVVIVNSTSLESIVAARARVEDLIIKSGRSIPMPDSYSQVLQTILQMRKVAKTYNTMERVHRVFVSEEALTTQLGIAPKTCRIILQTLHDLGDVLWYEDLDVGLFRRTIILDPMLLIDFIRQIINHRHTGLTISHIDLMAKRYWRDLGDPELMEAMKQVMQQFHLAYPANEDRNIQWDSHLVIPTYWQTKPPACWKFLGQDLNVQLSDANIIVRVCWEYHFAFGLPLALFDHVVVASISPFVEFDAGPDWILHNGIDNMTACRIMVGRDRRTLHRTIQVEAVIAKGSDTTHVSELWRTFTHLVGAFVRILSEFKGLHVSCNARDHKGRERELKNLLGSINPPSNLTWIPPSALWKFFLFRKDKPCEVAKKNTHEAVEGVHGCVEEKAQ